MLSQAGCSNYKVLIPIAGQIQRHVTTGDLAGVKKGERVFVNPTVQIPEKLVQTSGGEFTRIEIEAERRLARTSRTSLEANSAFETL